MKKRDSYYRREEWLTEEGLTLIKGWAKDGLTMPQIAHNMGIGQRTLYRWKDKHPEIEEALRVSKEIADYAMENALYKAGLEGNVTAMIFWLKNRRPKNWRDKPLDGTQSEGVLADLINGLADVKREVEGRQKEEVGEYGSLHGETEGIDETMDDGEAETD